MRFALEKTMKDRELLELAAKAAATQIVGLVDQMIAQPDHRTGGFVIRNDRGGDSCWNPLTDDGDALRLAVACGITMQQNFGGVLCYDNPDFADKSQAMVEVYENKRHDPYAATRRAIVRAAAEIGRSM